MKAIRAIDMEPSSEPIEAREVRFEGRTLLIVGPLAAARGEPGLDVERLDTDDFRDRHERAMRDHILGAPVMEPPDIHICSDLCSDSIIDRLLFGRARFGNEYPLATPTTPEPDQ